MHTDLASTPTAMPLHRLLGVYLQEARAECPRYLRSPGFVLPTLLFPAVFYLMFAVLLGGRNGADAPRYLLAAYSVFGVMGPGLFGFGIALALERDNGLITLKRALPMPPAAYLLGKMLMAMMMSALIIVILLGLATGVAGVSLAPARMLHLSVVGTLGALPFCALGLLLGTLVKGQGVPALVNLLYLPMAFLSGLWFPLSMLPKVIQRIAPWLPSYHLNVLALDAVGFTQGAVWPSLLWLAVFTAGVMALASWRLRRHG